MITRLAVAHSRRFALPAHCYVNVKRQFSLEGFSFCSNDGFLFFFNLRD